MFSIRCHKIRLDPSIIQEQWFWQCCGTARKAYNWALEQWEIEYKNGMKPTEVSLRRELNSIKKEQFPWMAKVPKAVVQQSVKNLGTAFNNFFKKTARYPNFKSRHRSKPAARLDNGPGTFKFDRKKVRLPKIGWIKTFECFRWPEGRPLSATLKREGERWFLAVVAEIEILSEHSDNQTINALGIDLGLTSALTLHTGEKVESPKPLRNNLRKLARLQRKLSRSKKGGSNRKKLIAKVSRLHWHIAQVRYDWQHKVTTQLSQNFNMICVEDLNVKGMMKNHPLARSISDVGWSELLRQLSYKTTTIKVGRFFPSSKKCSNCSNIVKALTLNVREWSCPTCGTVHDRDINAAKNILVEGLRTASCAGSNASGDGSSGRKHKRTAKLLSKNEELIPSIV